MVAAAIIFSILSQLFIIYDKGSAAGKNNNTCTQNVVKIFDKGYNGGAAGGQTSIRKSI